MKQLYFFLFLLLLPVALLAQRSGDVTSAAAGGGGIPPGDLYYCPETRSTYQIRADSALQALDKTQVPTTILYDRTAGTTYLDLFN